MFSDTFNKEGIGFPFPQLTVHQAIDFIKSHANIVEKAAEAEKAADAE